MSANVRIWSPNDADSASLTVSPGAVSTLPVTNLQDPLRGKVWRSTSLADQTLLIEWNEAFNFTAAALLRHNLSPASTLRWRFWGASAQSGTLVYDSGAVTFGTVIAAGDLRWGIDPWGGSDNFSGWNYAWSKLYPGDVIGARSASIVVSDAANDDPYVQASRLFIGSYFEPAIGIEQQDIDISWPEESEQRRTAGGSLRTDNFDPYRRISFRLKFLTAAEMNQLLEISRVSGMRKDMFLDVFSDDDGDMGRNFSGLVKLVQTPRFSNAGYDRWSVELVFEES